MKLLKPNIYQKDIFSINYDKLLKQNIKNLLFDIDNTISSTKDKVPSKEVKELFNNLKEKGFKVFIITNALKKRATKFQESLNVKTYHFSMKPSPRNYNKLIKENNLKHNECAAIGDQIYTDIKGANNLGILSILVDPISNKEFITTKINRIKENKLINKTKIIKKGEYYE
jgi:HAD superfamily phosphatase (TIGR01668 family)